MFGDSLKQHADIGDFVEIYTNTDNTSRFDLGRIIACDENYFITSMIAPDIFFDGFMLLTMDRVLQLSSDTNYIEKIKKLLPHFNVEYEEIGCLSGDLVASLLTYAKDNKRLVTIELLKSDLVDVQGFVKNVTQTMCEVELVNDYGEQNGNTNVALKDITEITCCTRKRRAMEYLYHLNYKDSE